MMTIGTFISPTSNRIFCFGWSCTCTAYIPTTLVYMITDIDSDYAYLVDSLFENHKIPNIDLDRFEVIE